MKQVAAIYVRLSREDEEKVDGSRESRSIENQIKTLSTYALKNDFNIYKIYCDDGVSGASLDRPGFNSLIKDMNMKRFNIVIVKDLSRLGRNLHQVGELVEEIFPTNNIRCIAVNDNYDSKTYDGDESIVLKIFLNAYYLKDFKNKIHNSIKYRAKHKSLVSTSKYGYLKKDGKFIIDPYASSIVRKIFELAADNVPMTKIAQWLNENKVLTRARYQCEVLKLPSNHIHLGDKWTSSFVQGILTDYEYCGHSLNCNRSKIMEPVLIRNTHEAIVSEEVFAKAQKVTRRKVKNDIPKPDNIGNIIYLKDTNKKFYLCYKDRKKPKYSCKTEHILLDMNDLHQAIFEDIRNVILEKDTYINRIKQRMLNDVGNIDELKIKLKKINLEYTKLLEKYFANNISEISFNKQCEELLFEIRKTENRIKDAAIVESKIELMVSRFNNFLRDIKLDESKIVDIIKTVVSKVEVAIIDGCIKLNIKYKFEG